GVEEEQTLFRRQRRRRVVGLAGETTAPRLLHSPYLWTVVFDIRRGLVFKFVLGDNRWRRWIRSGCWSGRNYRVCAVAAHAVSRSEVAGHRFPLLLGDGAR